MECQGSKMRVMDQGRSDVLQITRQAEMRTSPRYPVMNHMLSNSIPMAYLPDEASLQR